jgi:hypothetical protein
MDGTNKKAARVSAAEFESARDASAIACLFIEHVTARKESLPTRQSEGQSNVTRLNIAEVNAAMPNPPSAKPWQALQRGVDQCV